MFSFSSKKSNQLCDGIGPFETTACWDYQLTALQRAFAFIKTNESTALSLRFTYEYVKLVSQ